jgi:hypothetical protein
MLSMSFLRHVILKENTFFFYNTYLVVSVVVAVDLVRLLGHGGTGHHLEWFSV